MSKLTIYSNSKCKKVFSGGIALALSFMTLVLPGCKKETKEETTTNTTANYLFVNMNTLGMGNNKFENDSNYGKVTGNVDINKIVVDSNGTIWKDEEAKNNSSNVGKETIDTQGGKYEVVTTPEGETKVVDKTPGYEIVDKNGDVIASGDLKEDNIPDGYHNSNGEIIKEGYIVLDSNYYDKLGNLIFEKGDVVKESTYNTKIKGKLSKTKPSKVEESTTVIVKEEIITFTQEEIEEQLKNQGINPSDVFNTDVTKPNDETTTRPNVETTRQNVEVSTTENFTPSKGETTNNGTYNFNGLIFRSKADYDQWVLNGYEGYGIVNGIMMPENEEMKEAKKVR